MDIGKLVDEVTKESSANTANQEKTNFIDKKIGEEFELATIKLKVNQVSETDKINSKSSYQETRTARSGAKFVIVNLSVSNISKEKLSLGSSDVPLVDLQNRKFDMSDTYNYTDDNLVYKDIKPGFTETGTFCYEIPSDATSYSLQLGKKGTDDIYPIQLK